jgi:hypothetical protein
MEQKPFVLGGQVWQGHKGAAYRCPEDALTTDELVALPDKDGTISEIWLRRKQRLEARGSRKQTEYDGTRGKLREKRNSIRDSMKSDKELGLPANPDDLNEIQRIDRRMARLNVIQQESESEIAKMQSDGGTTERKLVLHDAQEAPPPAVQCERCQATPPPDHPKPGSWLRGHNIQCKIRHAKAS